MAIVSWRAGVSGSWTTAADWSAGAVPGAADDAVIGVGGSYTVSVTSTSVAAHSLQISNNQAVLAITGGAAAATLTTSAAGSNAGSIVGKAAGHWSCSSVPGLPKTSVVLGIILQGLTPPAPPRQCR